MIRFSQLAESEAAAAAQMARELTDLSDVAIDEYDLVGLLLTRLTIPTNGPTPPAVFAMAFLGTRLVNDLQCAQRMAEAGYPVQALTLVSSMYETTWTMAYIGNDDVLATAWRDWDDPTRSFRDVWTQTRGGLINLGVAEADADRHTEEKYRLYSRLKMGGHANPLLERKLAITRAGPDVLRHNGPDISDDGVRAAWFAMLVAIHLTIVAMWTLVQLHLRGNVPDDLVRRVMDVETREEALSARFTSRWPPHDPFPGKWRTR